MRGSYNGPKKLLVSCSLRTIANSFAVLWPPAFVKYSRKQSLSSFNASKRPSAPVFWDPGASCTSLLTCSAWFFGSMSSRLPLALNSMKMRNHLPALVSNTKRKCPILRLQPVRVAKCSVDCQGCLVNPPKRHRDAHFLQLIELTFTSIPGSTAKTWPPLHPAPLLRRNPACARLQPVASATTTGPSLIGQLNAFKKCSRKFSKAIGHVGLCCGTQHK